jgi:aquaporin Z
MFTINRLSLVAAEFLGAAIWTMVALVMSETTAVAYFIGTSVAVALAVSYLIFNTVSGPHFNPAISFGMWTARRISTLRAIAFIVAQLLGGLASWQLYQYLTNHKSGCGTWSAQFQRRLYPGTAGWWPDRHQPL